MLPVQPCNQVSREKPRINLLSGPAADAICDDEEVVGGFGGILAFSVHLLDVGNDHCLVQEVAKVLARDWNKQ